MPLVPTVFLPFVNPGYHHVDEQGNRCSCDVVDGRCGFEATHTVLFIVMICWNSALLILIKKLYIHVAAIADCSRALALGTKSKSCS
jgi:hypothetical protein